VRLGAKAKSVLRQIHLVLALAASLPLLVLSVTGALLVFPEETRALVTPADLAVGSGERLLPPSKLIDAASAELSPADAIRRLLYPRNGTEPLVVETVHRSVLLDPYDGRILFNAPEGSDFKRLVTSIHVSLLAGELGQWITSLSSVALVFLCLSGLWLWFPLGRWKREHFSVAVRKGWRRTNWDLHRTVGLYASAILLVISLTGASIGFWDAASAALYFVTWSKPSPPGHLVTLETDPQIPKVALDPDRILEIAQDEFPGHEPHRFYLPQNETKPYRVFLNPPGEHEVRLGEVRLEIDPYTGAILHEESPRTMNRGDIATRWILPLHYGTFGGTLTKALWLVGCLCPIALAATGTVLWLNRKAKERRAHATRRTIARRDSRSVEASDRAASPAVAAAPPGLAVPAEEHEIVS
jgi:uncharacterized iron-regulated membrane protein